MARCWHKWNIEKSVREALDGSGYKITRTTKTCRKCGEVRIRERIW